MYKKLLVPVEDTLFGAELVGESVELAAAWGAHVVFFHAVPDEGSILGDAGLLHAMAPTQFLQKYEWARRAVVARAQVAARALGVESTGVSRPAKGPLHDVIVRIAQEHDCDVIAMSTHGPSLSRLMTNASVGAKLLTHSPMPVLFVVTGGTGKEAMRRAIAQFRDEHRSLGVVVQGLSGLLARAKGSVDAPLETEVIGAALHYLGEFSGQLHHANEEAVLFPRLLERCPQITEQLTSLKSEHAREAELLQVAQSAVAKAQSMSFSSQGELIEVVDAIAKHVIQHIAVEERYLLPAAQAVLTQDDWREVEASLSQGRTPAKGHESSEELNLMFSRLAVLLPN